MATTRTRTTTSTTAKAGTTRILNCVPSPSTENDWRLHNAEDAGLLASSARAAPRSKDLREDTWWKIGDQGATGACVGWASTDSVLRWHLVQAGRLAKNEPLSVRFPWYATRSCRSAPARCTSARSRRSTPSRPSSRWRPTSTSAPPSPAGGVPS
jgi:hypothetical protein